MPTVFTPKKELKWARNKLFKMTKERNTTFRNN